MEEEKPPVEKLLFEMSDTLDKRFTELTSVLSRTSNEITMLQDSFITLDRRVAGVEQRRFTSERARSMISQSDSSHEAALAREIVAREALAKKVEQISVKTEELNRKQDSQTLLLQQLIELTKNPIVRHLVTAIGTAALVWLSSHGVK